MSLTKHTIEGVVLKALDFKENDQILTVFTAEKGIIKLIAKKPKGKKFANLKLSALLKVEFIYEETKSNLLKCLEFNVLDSFVCLREKYAFLETAGKLLQAVIASQDELRPNPKVYELLLYYLHKIPQVPVKNLESSFMLKIMRAEGLINLNLACAICHIPLEDLWLTDGLYFCVDHAPFSALTLNKDELLSYMQLTACRSLTELKSVNLSDSLGEKISTLFYLQFQA